MRFFNFCTSGCATGGRDCRGRSRQLTASALLLSWTLAAGIRLSAAEQTLELTNSSPAKFELPWPYAESALREPRGYNHHGASSRSILQTATVENTGSKPFTGGDLLVDGKSFRDRLEPISDGRAVFFAWTQLRSHAASGLKAAQDPWAMLRLWSYTLCGEDTKGLSTLLSRRNIEGRAVPLNGHVAGEYNLGGRWAVLDGDQNITYLNLDNRTLAGYAEIRADPFLALRTKPFGRYAKYSLAAAQYNAGLFEYIAKATPKPLKTKPSDEAAPSPATLYPGEKLIYHFDRAAEKQVGLQDAPEWKRAAPAALRLMELQASPSARDWKMGALEIKTGYPIVAAENVTTGKHVTVATEDLVYTCRVPVALATDRVSVWMQRSLASLPALHPGSNSVVLQASEAAAAQLRLHYQTEGLPPQPASPALTVRTFFQDETPEFAISTEEGCDRLWWQIASDPQFTFVAPNFEAVQAITSKITFDPLGETFFSDRADYFVRAKTVRQGVWSEWSAPAKFRVAKPLPPLDLSATSQSGGQIRLQWRGAGDEFVIYNSNRLDFLPERYAQEQIVSMRGLEVLAQRPNHNQVATTREHTCDLKPAGRYFRIVAKRGTAWSNPSPLFTLPQALATGLPPPVVFQIRWMTQETEPHDLYLGEERPLE